MIKRSLIYMFVVIAAAGLVLSQVYNSKLLDGQTVTFLFPPSIQHAATTIHVVQRSTASHTIPAVNVTNSNNISLIQTNIVLLQKQLFNAQRVIAQSNQSVFTIQAQINNLTKIMEQAKKVEQERQDAQLQRIALPVTNYDKLKHCSTDQTYGNTNYLTYLTHFACGHVTVFPNGTTLRQFTMFVNDFHGSGAPLNITTNKTDPVVFHAWEFNGTVPGPTLRVTAGDHVRITLINSKESAFAHGMHMHSIHPGSMDGVMGLSGMIFPGLNFTYDFIAQPVGVYPYHCHMSPVEEHISRGLYGMLIIDPVTPRPHAVEMVMTLNAYTFSFQGLNGSGHLAPLIPATMQQMRQNLSSIEEQDDDGNGPDNQFYTVNGMVFGYEGKHMIHLFTNTPYRIYLLNVVEFDTLNSFHIHGTMGNYTDMGTLTTPKVYTDLITMAQMDRGIFEFSYKYPGEFMFHSHINHFSDLGWVGFFVVTKPGQQPFQNGG